MHYLDLTLPTPAENLAFDEALLDASESRTFPEVLRVWEATEYFVVVGYANKVATEVDLNACERDNIPVLRRCSGGGTVLQGPGCLNYALTLRVERNLQLETIRGTNEYILAKNSAALGELLRVRVAQEGHTDLAINSLKFSGNAQRRRNQSLLFHGSILVDVDIGLIERYLRPPSKEPEYRQKRLHREFLRNLEVPAQSIKEALCKIWGANSRMHFDDRLRKGVADLVHSKYGRPDWNLKF